MEFKYVPCNLCGLDQSKFIGKRRGPENNPGLETSIVECSQCSLIYPNPMPYFTGDELQNNFASPKEYFARDAEGRLEMFENVLREIEKIKPQKGRILDVGCGRGELLHVAKKRNWEAVGTEISEAFADYGKRKFNVNILIGDITNMDLPLESFDVICLISVIQYLQNPMKTLKKLNPLLKKDGILYIESTNEDASLFKIGDLFKSIKEGRKLTTHLSPLFPSYQIYGFNKRSISKALELADFEISRIKIAGISGGGNPGRNGISNVILLFIRRLIILIGGLIGKGHLLFCIARKKSEKTWYMPQGLQ